MPTVTSRDGTSLHYEEAGSGVPMVFVHEFAGDLRSWEPQMRYFSRRFRCIAYNARGYPPSAVPPEGQYSQDLAREDLLAVVQQLDAGPAHIVGLSMGGFAALHFGFHHAGLARSLVVAGCGYGAEPERRAQFREETEATARLIEAGDAASFADKYGTGPTRVQFQNKDPRGWREFRDQLAEHSLEGAARTMRGVQKERPSLFELRSEMASLTLPTLLLTGDEDDPCLAPNLFMKQHIATAVLQVMPGAGHTINLEDPDVFNRAVETFVSQVDAGRWQARDPRSSGGSILGFK